MRHTGTSGPMWNSFARGGQLDGRTFCLDLWKISGSSRHTSVSGGVFVYGTSQASDGLGLDEGRRCCCAAQVAGMRPQRGRGGAV